MRVSPFLTIPLFLLALLCGLAQAQTDEEKAIEKKRQAQQSQEDQQKLILEHVKEIRASLQAQRADLAKRGKGSVSIDEQTIEVIEPDPEEGTGVDLSSDDVAVLPGDERWTLDKSDFRFETPHYVTVDTAAGKTRTYFALTYAITNSSAQARRIAPSFILAMDKGIFRNAHGGLMAERSLAKALGRPLADDGPPSESMLGLTAPLESTSRLGQFALDPVTGESKLAPHATFEPGQTRFGAALWSDLPADFQELKIIVDGLSNAHRHENHLRRVLILTFEKSGDGIQRNALAFKEKKWGWQWMWDQEISIPYAEDPKVPQLKIQTLQTAAGAEKLVFAFPFKLENHSGSSQQLAINTVSFVCPMELTVGGEKLNVEARVLDDGYSTIYKSQLLKELGKESAPDRFALGNTPPEGQTAGELRNFFLEAGKDAGDLWAVFDADDVNWEDLRGQIEAELTTRLDKKALSQAKWEQVIQAVEPDNKDLAAKNPGFLYDPRRLLSDDEMKQVKEQVTKDLPGALDAAKVKKMITAYFDCTASLSSGSFRLTRSYRRAGLVDETWLKAWEDLGKN